MAQNVQQEERIQLLELKIDVGTGRATGRSTRKLPEESKFLPALTHTHGCGARRAVA